MILTEEKADVKTQGNFDTKAFSIKANGKAFSILTDKIYTHKVRSVVRELSCNAQDSHTEKGNPNPFKVHLPTSLEPWFSVRDYGTGMSHKQMMTLYTEVFTSTRGHSNEFTGALGLGRFSIFSLVDSFTVTSWYGGEKTVYSCYKDETGIPQLAVLTVEESSEQSGVEVKSTVDGRSHEFMIEAVNVYQYFDTTPLINIKSVAEQIEARKKSYVIVTPKFAVTTQRGSIKAVMGNVAYEIPSQGYDTSMQVEGYIKFALAEIEFDAGREQLSLSDRTKKILAQRIKEFKEEIKPIILAQVEVQPTKFKKFLEFNKVGGGLLANFLDRTDRKTYELPQSKTPFKSYYRSGYRSSIPKSEDTSINYEGECTLHIFEDKPRIEARLRAWLRNMSGQHKAIFLKPEHIAEMEVDAEFVLDPEVVIPKLESAPRSSNPQCKVKTFLRNGEVGPDRDSGWSHAEVDISDDTEERVYIELNNWKHVDCPAWLSSCRRINETLNTLKDYIEVPEVYGFKTVVLKSAAFKKGKWIKLEDYIKREVKDVTPPKVYIIESDDTELLNEIANRIKHEDFVKFKIAYELTLKDDNVSLWETLGFTLDKDNSCDIMHAEIMRKYPMLKFVSQWEVEYNKATILNYLNEKAGE